MSSLPLEPVEGGGREAGEVEGSAGVAELVYAQDLGSCGATHPGSSPGARI